MIKTFVLEIESMKEVGTMWQSRISDLNSHEIAAPQLHNIMYFKRHV